jgi:integrase
MRPNEMLALKWLHVDFDMRCVTIREGRVQGIEGLPKTLSSNPPIRCSAAAASSTAVSM